MILKPGDSIKTLDLSRTAHSRVCRIKLTSQSRSKNDNKRNNFPFSENPMNESNIIFTSRYDLIPTPEFKTMLRSVVSCFAFQAFFSTYKNTIT